MDVRRIPRSSAVGHRTLNTGIESKRWRTRRYGAQDTSDLALGDLPTGQTLQSQHG
jgi:hypothetical protein